MESLAIPASDGWNMFHQLMREGNLSARLCTNACLAALAPTQQNIVSMSSQPRSIRALLKR
jgi:hypothetical protein